MKLRKLSTLASALALAFAAHASALPTPFSATTADGNGADSFIRLGQPTTNFGGGSGVVVKDSNGGSTTRLGYLRFDLSDVKKNFTDATLGLTVTTNNPVPVQHTVNVYGLNDGVGENWGEGTLNFNNAPGNGPTEFVNSDTTLLGSFVVPAVATPNAFNFQSNALATFLNQDTDGLATIILQRDGGSGSNNLVFASKENGGQPAPTLSGAREGDSRSFTAVQDSFVRLGQATTNFGTATQVVIKDSNNGSTTRKGYFQFDISSLTTAALGAGLTLDVSTNNQGGGGSTPQEFTVQVFGLNDGAGEFWNETDINFNNAPGNQAGDNFDPSETTLLGEFTVENNDGGRIIFSSLELVDFINADTNGLATLLLRREGGNGGFNLAFASRENGTLLAPTLDIVVDVPEPATATLALLGLAGLARRRRRVA